MNKQRLVFPNGFLWGTATAAHQVEGGNVWNDWYLFELAGNVANQEVSGATCNHYNLFRDDFDLAKSFGQNAHRLSVEWSRIEKTEGVFDYKEIEHYRDVLKYLKVNGFTTFVTLHHFTSPAWFMKKGGWEKKQSINQFTRFARFAVEELGEYVDFWATFNEALVSYVPAGWLVGMFPPQKKNLISFFKVINNIAKSHNAVYDAIKKLRKGTQIGIVEMNGIYTAHGLLKPFEKAINYLLNFYLIDKVFAKCDYIGLNYYFGFSERYSKNDLPKNDLGWPIDSKTFYNTVMLMTERYKKMPFFITENGIADANDDKRKAFIHDHITALHQALKDGANVLGYFHWSLIDNFEWKLGFAPKFGLIEINYKTQERIPRPSAFYYKEICESNSIDV